MKLSIVYGVKIEKYEIIDRLKKLLEVKSDSLEELLGLYKDTFEDESLYIEVYCIGNYVVVGNTIDSEEGSNILEITELNSDNEYTQDIEQLLIDINMEEEGKILNNKFKFMFVSQNESSNVINLS